MLHMPHSVLHNNIITCLKYAPVSRVMLKYAAYKPLDPCFQKIRLKSMHKTCSEGPGVQRNWGIQSKVWRYSSINCRIEGLL